MLEVLFLHFLVKVVIETRVVDGVYIYMLMGLWEGLLEEGVMLLDVSSVGRV